MRVLRGRSGSCGRFSFVEGGRGSGGRAVRVMCGSPVCPVCGPKVWAGPAVPLWRSVAAWSARGGRVVLVTATVPHWRTEGLGEVLDDLSAVWSSTVSGRPWRRLADQFVVSGWARLLEVTDGPQGWHPHFHVLVLLPGSTSVDAVAAFVGALRERWLEACAQVGRPVSVGAEAFTVHGKLLVRPDRGVVDYLVKGPGPAVSKLADAVASGDRAARARWREFQSALIGRTRLSRSRAFIAVGEQPSRRQERGSRLCGDDEDCRWCSPLWVAVVPRRCRSPCSPGRACRSVSGGLGSGADEDGVFTGEVHEHVCREFVSRLDAGGAGHRVLECCALPRLRKTDWELITD